MIAAKLLQWSDYLLQGCIVECWLQCVKFHEEGFCLFRRNSPASSQPTANSELPLSTADTWNKTEAGCRMVAIPVEVLTLIGTWKLRTKRTKPTDFIFATRKGKPENANNILRRHVYPACDALGIPRANWLTFRRTFSTWSHKHGLPPKDLAELMGHANVDMPFEYAVGMDANKQASAAKLGKELVTLVTFCQQRLKW